MMPRIILVKGNGQRIFIDCAQVPHPGAGPGTLEIPNVEIRTHNDPNPANQYNYLYFPQGAAGPAQPDDLVIHLRGPVQEDNLILPFNGGQIPAQPPDVADEVTVKLNV
jgi:hypothetical protein